MNGVLSFVLFAVLFFFMMRFGCGAHAGHGGHHGAHRTRDDDSPDSATRTANNIDPVCGMRVDPTNSYAKMYRGVQYRFCSRECLDKFDAAPDKFASHSSHDQHHGGHCA